MDYIRIKNSSLTKNTFWRVKRWPKKWKRIFLMKIYSKKLMLEIYISSYISLDLQSWSWILILLFTSCVMLVLLLLLLSHFSCVRLCVTHRRQPTRLRCPRDSPGKNTGVGCHFLLQCMKVKSEREVTQSCSTLSDPMDCNPPGFSVHGIFQARVLEWGAIAFDLNNRK